jgi:PHD/YefM family antitoxin component YafN of YafNO toxin-antitoxin module
VSQTLRLNIFSEVDSKAKLLEMMKKNQGQHICIVHLSMIDDLYGKNEENRNQYMEEALQDFQYVILTTGRGREDAYASLKKEYKTRTRFIYRNQFEKAFERALEVPGEEFFIVKFFLVKILLGG